MTGATAQATPFGGEPPGEIPLAAAPLVRVLAQVRFQNMAVFKRDNFIAPFIEALLEGYPLLEEGRETQILIGPDGASQNFPANPVWKLRSLDLGWTVTVSPGSLAVETAAYTSRDDFLGRFKTVCAAFIATIGRSRVERLGVRYTNQIASDDLSHSELVAFFKEEARGGLSVPLGAASVQHSLNDTLFVVGDSSIQGRWGVLPPSVVFDPSLPPVAHASWFLDVDCFRQDATAMDADILETRARELATHEYSLFRWLVTDAFIERFRVA